MKNKIYSSFAEAVKDIPDGATIMMHSFSGAGGVAQNLILALRDQGAKELTVIACNTGLGPGIYRKPGFEPVVTPNLLVESGQVKKVYSCLNTASSASRYGPTGENALEVGVRSGKVEWEPCPQGVLAERIRAGAVGMGGFYSPVGVGTLLERGKEKKIINGREYLLETPLRADYAFVRAFRSDPLGNLVYRGTSRAFNPLIAMAATVTIAEVDKIVDLGELEPERIDTPGCFVDRIVKVPEVRDERIS